MTYQAEFEPIELQEKTVLIEVESDEHRITRKIEAMFPDEPRMVKVASCESTGGYGFDIHARNPNSSASGLFQILMSKHGDRMRDLGLNVWDEDDNISFARVLFDERGLKPWLESVNCWAG